MAVFEPIKVRGLAEFSKGLRKLDGEAVKGLRLAQNEAAKVLVDATRPKVPARSGRARATVKARSTRTAARVSVGGNRAPYYQWLDWGGKVGRARSVERRYLSGGRYLYPALVQQRDTIEATLERQLAAVVRRAGLDVD